MRNYVFWFKAFIVLAASFVISMAWLFIEYGIEVPWYLLLIPILIGVLLNVTVRMFIRSQQ